MSKPLIRPTENQRATVRRMAALEIPHAIIAKRMGIMNSELKVHFARELRVAFSERKAMVGAYLFAAAKAGNITAIIFWLKTRAGWTETIKREISGPGGCPIHVMHQSKVIIQLPCNGHGLCAKIYDPDKRRAVYEKVLGYKLPVPPTPSELQELADPPDEDREDEDDDDPGTPSELGG